MNHPAKDGGVKAYQIASALARIHTNDFFITECKNGSTWIPPMQGALRFDALVINRSWMHSMIRIYEIKVSRSDYRQDAKLHLYKQYCNELVLACPKGLIGKQEVDDDIGLMWYYPDSKALRMVKKPRWMNNDPDPMVLLYIIKCKSKNDHIPFFSSNREYAEAYIAEKAEKKAIGHKLGSKMAHEIADLRQELKRLEAHGQQDYQKILGEVAQIMRNHKVSVWDDKNIPAALEKAFSIRCGPEIKKIKEQADYILEIIKNMEAGCKSDADQQTDLSE